MRLSFDDFVIDTTRYELRRNDEPCKLEPKVFDLIAHFAQHPNQIFSREQLVELLWKSRFVSDATISTCIKSARKALGDSGVTQRYIQTVRGRGFRFNAGVVHDTSATHGVSGHPPKTSASDRNDDPSLLVLPFRPLSDQPGSIQLASGLTMELLAILTRIPLLRLSARTHHYADLEVTPSARQIHDDLDVNFVLESSVQLVEGRHHINVGLADARTGFRLWSERFVVSGSVGAALREGVTAITARLEPQLYRAIVGLVGSVDNEKKGRALFLQASSMLALKGWHHDSFAKAADILRRSWQYEPEFALAPSLLSLVLGFGHRVGLMKDREQAKREALKAAERSLELDSMDSTVLGYSGCALADIGQPDRALPILRNAIELNPANAQAWAALGAACILHQRLDEGIAHLRHGIAISPLDSRLSIWGSVLTAGLLLSGDYAEALHQGQLACQRDDRNFMARVVLAGAHLARNENQQAHAALVDAYRIKPDLSRLQVLSLLGREVGEALLKLQCPTAGDS